ncbi:electron transport complex subunit RsxC [Candidatus Margulisiibacteriota bacterium]
MAFTFPGGLHIEEHKDTKDRPIETLTPPKKVIIPLCQHLGAPVEPLVNVGDEVKKGQRIGDSERYVSAPVHASISGKVTAIEPHLVCSGAQVMSVVIESDGKDEAHENVKPFPPLDTLSKRDIRNIVRGAGIVGLGGAAFPTRIKLDPPHDKEVDHIILNGSECEPYITCDHRIMLEQSSEILFGLKAIMKPTDAKSAIIAIENNKPDAIKMFEELTAKEDNVRVAALKTKYPQGGEKQLIKTLTGKEVPSGGLPLDVNVIVQNVGTAAAISEAIRTGMPLIKKVITVTGDAVKKPGNYKARIGMTIGEVLEQCGGFSKEPRKVILGGPMMGVAQYSLDVPVTKNVNCIIALSDKYVETYEEQNCVRCAKCVDTCPAYLQPLRLTEYAKKERWDDAKRIGAMDCIECGLCSYVCPSKIELVHYIKLAKDEIKKAAKK